MRSLHHLPALSVALSAALAAMSLSAGEEDPTMRFEPIDVFELEHASDPQIAPDGTRVVYVRNSMDIMRDRTRSDLWLVSVDGSDHRPVTSIGNASQPRWSPDGTRLAYVSKETEDGPAQVFCRWMDTGATARLSRLTHAPSDLTWSPDGRRIAFTMLVPAEPEPLVAPPAKPEGAEWADPPQVIRKVLYRHDGRGYLPDAFRHVFLLPADGGTARQLTSGDYHHEGPLAFSADGGTVYCSANRSENWEYEPRQSDIHGISVEDGSIARLTDRAGPDRHPAVSPDGRRIAWLGFDDAKLSYQNTRLYVMNADGSGRREITGELDRSVESPVWSADGSGLYFQYDDTGTTKVGFVTLDGVVTPLASHVGGVSLGRPYASGSFSADGSGTFAFTQTRPDHPADVAVGRQGSAEIRRVTRLNENLFARKPLAETEEFWLDSPVDNRRIQSWIVKPPGFDPARKYPLILEIHGGPFANYGDRFAVEMQLYAAAGFVVLYVNPRGSTGYGEEFANLIHHDYPGGDYDDLMAAVDAVIERGLADPDQLFVTGGSGGGILTAWIVGRTNRFRAAVSQKPVINWHSFVLTSDVYPYFADYWFPGPPWKHAEHYLRRSPISLVENVTTPTMLITGVDDHRTPISESEQFYQALKMHRVETALVRIPGAPHNIVERPSRFIVKVQHVLKWFEIHRDAD